ncbi:MAG: hypothetical protein JOZ75_00940 [Candidatus Dormibacteraeota bacterium]|nr:hypothetical protein [Candidatus Dormibacteraeota bacterium]
MAAVAHQEESSDDVLIWRYAASRAHAAAEEARARAQEATAAIERADRRLLKAIAPHVQRFVRGARIQRRSSPARAVERAEAERPATERPTVQEARNPELEVIEGGPGIWTPRVWEAAPQPRPHLLLAESSSWTSTPLSASFDDILLDAASVPLPAALLVYDDVLEWLQRLHGRGLTYGSVRASAVAVDQDGRCTLAEAGVELAEATARARLDDLQAATWILVQATGGARLVNRSPVFDPSQLEGLPLATRCLVEQTLAVEAAYRLTAARLRSNLALAARALLQEDWEPGARAWLASAAAASAVELAGHSQVAGAPAGDRDEHAKRPFGGIARREPRFMVGLGIAASASITLAVGTAVGITATHPAAHATVAERPAILAVPSPRAAPTVNASPAALAPPTPEPVTPSAATPVPSPTAVPVHVALPPVTVGPVTFTPFPVPTAQATPAPSPTFCLLGIIC